MKTVVDWGLYHQLNDNITPLSEDCLPMKTVVDWGLYHQLNDNITPLS